MDWFIEALQMAMAAILDDEPEPEEAINGNESDSWKGGMEEELSQIEKLNIWELVQAPPDANIVPSKWMLCCKCNAQGKITCYQARIVTKGYVQIFGRDFKEMFAPTICLASVMNSTGSPVLSFSFHASYSLFSLFHTYCFTLTDAMPRRLRSSTCSIIFI